MRNEKVTLRRHIILLHENTRTFNANCFRIFTAWYCILCIQLIRERLSEKSTKVHAKKPKGGLVVRLNFAYWPKGNVQVCIFAREEFVFSLRRPFSVALLSLPHVFEF